jgi:hypothetical protein
VGSLLAPFPHPSRDDRNFLAPSAYAPEILEYVNDRLPRVRDADGTLEEARLRRNMLSSMPLCFNLCAPLRNRPSDACDLLRRVFGLDAQRLVSVHGIEQIECEWAPPPAHGIGDRTAFDAVVAYADASDRVRILGIETKYTDTFSPTEYAKPGVVKEAGRRTAYQDQMKHAGWFVEDAADRLWPRATNQMWRNTMLAAACETLPGVSQAHVAVVHLFNDPAAEVAISSVQDQLNPEFRDRVLDVPLERILRNAPTSLDDWAAALAERYTDLTPVCKGTEGERARLQANLDRWFSKGSWAILEPWQSDPYSFGCARPLARLLDGVLVVEIWREDNWSGFYPAIEHRVVTRGDRTEVDLDGGRWRLTGEIPAEFIQPLADLRRSLG